MKHRIALLLALIFAASIASGASGPDREMLKWISRRPPIKKIVIEGNTHFTDGQIKGRMYSKERNLWRAIKGDRRSKVQRENFGRDTLEVQYLYLTAGFLNVKVHHQYQMIGKDSSAQITLTIIEGPQLFYGERKVTGDYPGQYAFQINKIAQSLKEGAPINPFEIRKAEFDMKTHLANGGHPYATVQSQIDTTRAQARTPVTFVVYGDSLVHFGNVNITGTSNFPEYTARRELKIAPGAVYRRQDLIDSQRRLFESGYFSTLQLRQSPNPTNRLAPDFELRVRERKPHYFSFNTGAGQSEVRDLQWDVAGAFGKRNLFGSRQTELSAKYSFSVGRDSRLIKHEYQLSYTEPWLLGVRMPLSLSAKWQPPLKHEVQDFKVSSWSLAAENVKWFGTRMRTTLGFEYQSVEISGVAPELEEILRLQEKIAVRRRLYGEIRRDSRDNIFVPLRGALITMSADYYGGFLGGDDNFYKLQASWAKYTAVWPGWISANRIKIGWAKPFGKSAIVPLDEALYLGGANSVRGFKENSLGPKDPNGEPLGARYQLIFNQEFRWKTLPVLEALPMIGGLFEELPLWQSIFLDVGNGFNSLDDLHFKDFAYSYGTGVQILSPAGPIRLDYARVIPTERFGFTDRWHFTILYAF